MAASAASTGLPSAQIYFRASELNERAILLNQADIVYPETALATGISGVVTLRLLIDHQGTLRDASVMDSRPAGVFENAALEAVRTLRFRPAIRKGVAVGSVKIIEVPSIRTANAPGVALSRRGAAGPRASSGPAYNPPLSLAARWCSSVGRATDS